MDIDDAYSANCAHVYDGHCMCHQRPHVIKAAQALSLQLLNISSLHEEESSLHSVFYIETGLRSCKLGMYETPETETTLL